jgi:glycopeptide antibiotics resistance protein
VSRSVASAVLIGSIGLMLAVTFPWGDLLGHTHWMRVRWIPFFSRPARAFDLVGNVLLCVPIGVGTALLWPARARRRAATLALALALTSEIAQLFSHYRFPSTTDLVCNVAGAVLGAVAVEWLVDRQGSR